MTVASHNLVCKMYIVVVTTRTKLYYRKENSASSTLNDDNGYADLLTRSLRKLKAKG